MSGSIAVLPTVSDLKTMERVPTNNSPIASKKNTVVLIFDWDDTLLPSTWLVKQGLRLDQPEVIPQFAIDILQKLEKSIINILTTAKRFGEVRIITNAETGWVELSARRFVPAVVPYLEDIKVLSARSTFEAQFPEPFEWKVAAFRQEIGSFLEDQNMKNDREEKGSMELEQHQQQENPVKGDDQISIISFGDSVHERDAVWICTKQIPNVFTKSIKFVERPSAEQLCKEIDLVNNCMDYVATYVGELDLMLTISLLGQTEENTTDISPASSDSEDISFH